MIDHIAPAPESVDAVQHPLGPANDARRPLIDVSVLGAALANRSSLLAELSVQFDPAERRVTVCGELDAVAVPMLAEVMKTLSDTEPGDITIDLAGVSFIDAGGLGCLVGFANYLAARGATLSVVAASPRLRRVFGIVHLGALLRAS